jgi:hypothetical protein
VSSISKRLSLRVPANVSGPVVGVDCDSEVDSRFGNQNYCDGYTKGYMGETNKLTGK